METDGFRFRLARLRTLVADFSSKPGPVRAAACLFLLVLAFAVIATPDGMISWGPPAVITAYALASLAASRSTLLALTVACLAVLVFLSGAFTNAAGTGDVFVSLAFAGTGIAALGCTRLRVIRLAEDALVARHTLTDQLAEQGRQHAEQLARSEVRYATLFSDMNHGHAEQDISEAKRMIDEAKANGATDFQRLATEDPEFIDRCLAAIKVNRVNDALLHMMGYADHAELVAKPPTENAVDARRVMQEQLHAMFDGRHHFAATATLLGKDNRKVTVAVGVNVPNDWSVSLSTHIDITEQLRAREAIASAREDLGRASRAVAIGAVSTTLSHELNQPLLAISLDTRSAKRWLEKAPPQLEHAREALGRVSANADRMNAIITNTREKLVKGSKEFAKVDLRQLLTETSYLLEGDLAARRARLQLAFHDDVVEVFGDRIDIQQLFINLIVNAADAMATIECERIVTISSRMTAADILIVDVSDNGPGIAEENLKLVFEPFFSTKSGGMGIGLQICRSIVEAFQGTITARNNHGRGATFSITFPATEDLPHEGRLQNATTRQETETTI